VTVVTVEEEVVPLKPLEVRSEESTEENGGEEEKD